MPLIKSISGFRGTIGGKPDTGLTPVDIVKLTSAFVCLIRRNGVKRPRIVVGRDGRISGLWLTSWFAEPYKPWVSMSSI